MLAEAAQPNKGLLMASDKELANPIAKRWRHCVSMLAEGSAVALAFSIATLFYPNST